MMNQEQKLDAEFAKFGMRPYIYHYREAVKPFSAVTIVAPSHSEYTFANLACFVRSGIEGARRNTCPTSYLLYYLAGVGIHGVAICDRRDNFSRRRGRVIAKGRLLKYLEEQEVEFHQG